MSIEINLRDWLEQPIILGLKPWGYGPLKFEKVKVRAPNRGINGVTWTFSIFENVTNVSGPFELSDITDED